MEEDGKDKRVTNEEVLERVGRRTDNETGLFTNGSNGRTSFLKRYKIIDDIKESGKYVQLKKIAEVRRQWRATF